MPIRAKRARENQAALEMKSYGTTWVLLPKIRTPPLMQRADEYKLNGYH